MNHRTSRRTRRIGIWLAVLLALLAGYLGWFVPNYGWGLGALGALLSILAELLMVMLFAVMQFVAIFWFLGRARVYWLGPGESGVSFADYRGNREILDLASRVVTLLRGVKTFREMGGEVPRGLLLVGPPGTGKSYLAQAIATEAGVPFCYSSAPSFQNMFFGVGNLRIMMIYNAARKKAREHGAAIVFIDEIDAIGMSRSNQMGAMGIFGGGGLGLLNELLLQMDPPAIDYTWTGRLLRTFGLRRGRAQTFPVLTIGASVTGDTPILVRRGDEVRRMPIGEFVDAFHADGEADRQIPISGWQTLGYRGPSNARLGGREDRDYFGRADFVDVRGVFRHRVDHVYEVEYLGGRIRATGDHSVFVRDVGGRGRIGPKRVDRLQPGDVLVNLPYTVDRADVRLSAGRGCAGGRAVGTRGWARGDGPTGRSGALAVVGVNREPALDVQWLSSVRGIESASGCCEAAAGRANPEGGTLPATVAGRVEIGNRSDPFPEDPRLFTPVKEPVVRRVERIPFDGYVYDLCGCDNEAFFGGESPILLHNTNLPEVLDPALLRPGRFDQKLSIDPPDMVGRLDILRYYLGKTKHDPDFPVERAAGDTIHYTPVMIKHVINEAAVFAHFHGREQITYADFTAARETYEWGLRQPIQRMNAEDRRRLAYHEAGHAVAQYLLQPDDRVVKVTIVRHGQALGLSATKPVEERHTQSQEEILADIQVSLASRAAEELFLDTKLSGVTQDLTQATQLAAAAVGWFGMDGSLYSYRAFNQTVPDGSAKRRIEKMLDRCYESVRALLDANRPFVEAVARGLMERDELTGEEVAELAQRTEASLLTRPPA